MFDVQRRTLVKGLAAAPLVLLLPTGAHAVEPNLTLYKSTGGYAYETDTFYIARQWNREYRQYTFTVTWGGNRDVKSGSKYYRHKLESTRLKYDGKNVLFTRFVTSKATPEVYWLNTSRAQFTMTTRITDLSKNKTWYRSALIIF